MIIQLQYQMKDRNRGVSAKLNSSHSSVTQPVNESKNVRRIQQIESLHLQFQDLKKKIKDVQNKNEKIIENIHRRYDFKKKPITSQSMVQRTPIVYYEQQPNTEHHLQNKSVNSNQSQIDFHINRPIVKKTSNIRKNVNNLQHQSMEYRKNQIQRDGSQVSSKNNFNPMNKQISMGPAPGYYYGSASQVRGSNAPSDQYSVTQFPNMQNMQNMPFQMSMQFPPYPSAPYNQLDNPYTNNNNYQLETAIRKQRQRVKALEEELSEKEEQTIALKRLQKKLKNFSAQYNEKMEDMLEQFMQKIVQRKMNQIEKHVKKAQHKVRKLQHVINDKQQAHRSRRNIEDHKNRRSKSRSKRDTSPRTTPNSSLPRGPGTRKTLLHQQPHVGQSYSASKSKQSDNSKTSSVQFEAIASKYEEMIKNKTKELENSENKLKRKENQLLEMSARCSSLELKLSELEQIPRKVNKFNSSERDDNLLSNLDFDIQKDEKIRELSRKVTEMEDQIKKKHIQIMEKDAHTDKITKKMGDLELKSKRYQVESKKLKEQLKRVENSFGKDDNELHLKLKRLQNELQSKEKELSLIKQKCIKTQNQKIQKDCENITILNRLKKIQQLLTVKQEKISQLQKIIQSNNSNQLPDLLQRSVVQDKGDENFDIHHLQEEKQKLEQLITKKDQELFILKKNNQSLLNRFGERDDENGNLKKQIQNLMNQNESMQNNIKSLEFQKYNKNTKNETSPLQQLLEQNQCISQNEENPAIRQELDELRIKYEQSQRQLKAQKHETLQYNTKLIKMNSELSYYRDLLSQRQGKYEKLRRQFEQIRIVNNQLEQTVQDKDHQLEIEKKVNNQKILELETQWIQFEQQMRNKQQLQNPNNISDLRSSRNFSQESFVGYKNTFNSMNAQNEHLTEKLKEAEKIIEIQKEMENKIINEYRNNIDKIKAQLRQKVKHNDELTQDLENIRRKIKAIELNQARLKNMSENSEQKQTPNGSSSQIYILELQLSELKDLNAKQEAVEQQLFQQISECKDENENLKCLISTKDKKISQLEDIIELKEMNVNFSSYISSTQNKSKIKDSLQSNSSLKYSMVSNNPNKTIELQLSEAGESFFQQNQSMVSNVSSMYGRQQFPYEKVQLRRVEQRRLFSKTAAYIKSLKKAIDQKNKKIKLLEKKIQSLRNSQLIRKDIYQVKELNDIEAEQQDEIFKDYSSCQNVRTTTQRYKLKQLEHETKLTIEQNYLLNNQIESLQDELMKAEEQENSLMKLKDLYKDEIKSLIKKNQEQAKTFQDQVKRQKMKVEQSESVQRMQALKLLFIKKINAVITMINQSSKSKKKDEHRKELEEYSKLICNFLQIDEQTREKILSQIRK